MEEGETGDKARQQFPKGQNRPLWSTRGSVAGHQTLYDGDDTYWVNKRLTQPLPAISWRERTEKVVNLFCFCLFLVFFVFCSRCAVVSNGHICAGVLAHSSPTTQCLV